MVHRRQDQPAPQQSTDEDQGSVIRSRESLDTAITAPKMPDPHARIGEELVRAGFITQEQLEEALQLQQASEKRMRLGQFLVARAYVTPEQVTLALVRKLGIPIVDLNYVRPDPHALKLLRRDLYGRYQAMPLYTHGNRVIVAMADPLHHETISELRVAIGREIEPVYAPAEAILRSASANLSSDGQTAKPAFTGRDAQTGEGLVDSLVREAVALGASDVHLIPESEQFVVIFRLRGDLVHAHSLGPDQYPMALNRIKAASGMPTGAARRPLDGVMKVDMGDRLIEIRSSVVPTIHGESAVLRLFDPHRIPDTLDELGYDDEASEQLRDSIMQPHGLFVVSGPTGAGKTTLLMAMAREVIRSGRKLITVEDPVEYRISGAVQIQVAPERGMTTAEALRGIVRQDPDVILVGEIRDAETARLAMMAAVTGRLVLASTHASSVATTISRLLDLGVEDYQIRSGLSAILSQRLIRTIHGGRMPLYEFAAVDDRIRQAINVGMSTDVIETAAIKSGMIPMRERAMNAYRSGQVPRDAVETFLRE